MIKARGWYFVLYRVLLPLRRARSCWRDVGSGSQLCKVCGSTQDEVDFIVSTPTWQTVVPARWQRWAVCMACFDRFANERGVHTVKVFLVNGP